MPSSDDDDAVFSPRRRRLVVRHMVVLPSMVSVEVVIMISSSGVANTAVSVVV